MPKQSTIDTERQLMEALDRIITNAQDLVDGITWHTEIPPSLVPKDRKVIGENLSWEVSPTTLDTVFSRDKEWRKERAKEAKKSAEPALVELAVAAEAVAALMQRLCQDVQDREILA